MKRDLTPFEVWVKQRLILKNVTNLELANEIGIIPQYLNKITTGRIKSSMYNEKIIDILALDETDRERAEQILKERLKVS